MRHFLYVRYGTELLLVLGCLLIYAMPQRDFSPEQIPQGPEFSYLVSSGTTAAQIFRQTGKIPLWNPLIGRGEPLIENPFSFVLNPLMTPPIFVWGPIQGAKLSILGHVMLMGAGGWMLAHTLKLGTAGRLMMGLLLGSSGSFAAAFGEGFYQLGAGQAYLPWIYAGWMGLLKRQGRRYVGIFAVFSMLLVLAGGFWYVLPAAITCVILAVWYMPTQPRRIVIAILFTAGLCAVRILPLFIHRNFIEHTTFNPDIPHSLGELIISFFIRNPQPERYLNAIYYHYIISPIFSVFILVLWVFYGRRSKILIPALILIAFFVLWVWEANPLVKVAENIFPLLEQWRYRGRLLAAATPWLAVIVSVCFNDLVSYFINRYRNEYRRKYYYIYTLALTSLILSATFTALDVLHNWQRVTGTIPYLSLNRPPLYELRRLHPGAFLSVLTPDFSDYLPFYQTLARAAFGNPEYRPASVPYTIGIKENTQFLPEYAIAYGGDFRQFVMDSGYQTLTEATDGFEQVLWHNPDSPSYAFTVSPLRFENNFSPLTRFEVTSAAYSHQIDQVIISIDQYSPGDLLVIQETAYPGWKVQINGSPATLESVAGLLGVRLPDQAQPLTIIFTYIPGWLYIGSGITLFTIVVLTFYLLRFDYWIWHAWK